MLTVYLGFLQPKQLNQPGPKSQVGRINLHVFPRKSGAPGAGDHVPAGLINKIDASQGKKLFVHAVYKINLGTKMKWGCLTYRENYV